MICINRHTDYAVRILLALAKHHFGMRLSTSQIRDEMLIPPALIQRIVADLARGKFIDTFPGRDGGLQLARPSAQINLKQVVEYFEGPISISDYLTDDLDCPFEAQCPVRISWGGLQTIITNELEKISVQRLALEAKQIEVSSAKSGALSSIKSVE